MQNRMKIQYIIICLLMMLVLFISESIEFDNRRVNGASFHLESDTINISESEVLF